MAIYVFGLQLPPHIKTRSVFNSEFDFRHTLVAADDLLTQGADFDKSVSALTAITAHKAEQATTAGTSRNHHRG